MGKIIKSELETVQIKKEKFTLGMKGKFIIEFINDTFGPYDYKFGREDCYYIDGLEDRGSVKFPLKNKEFNNIEIFLETDDVIICTGERTNLSGEAKAFIDVINIKTEKKQRLYTGEVNLIYNSEKEIIINANFDGIFKTLALDIETLEVKEGKEEKLLAFFKCIYNESEKKWYRLDFKKEDFVNFELEFYELILLDDINGYPFEFDRNNFLVNVNKSIDVWKISCETINFNNLNFLNSQHYIISNYIKLKIFSINLLRPYVGVLYEENVFGILFRYFFTIFFLIFIMLKISNIMQLENLYLPVILPIFIYILILFLLYKLKIGKNGIYLLFVYTLLSPFKPIILILSKNNNIYIAELLEDYSFENIDKEFKKKIIITTK